MIQLTPQMRILVGVEAVDFRKGIDGLARACREVLAADPLSGWLFVFRNRRQTALRILVYDGQGFWLAHKRLFPGSVSLVADGGDAGDTAGGASTAAPDRRRSIPRPPMPPQCGGGWRGDRCTATLTF